MTICAKFLGGPTPHYTISVMATPTQGGTVSGGGSKEEGSSCTVVATPAQGYAFTGWYENGQIVSSNPSYTFTVQNARTLQARFAESTGVTIAVSSSSDQATVSGGGTYEVGDSVTVNTAANQGAQIFVLMAGMRTDLRYQTMSHTRSRLNATERLWLNGLMNPKP